jgi:type II secretory pathway component HofQ
MKKPILGLVLAALSTSALAADSARAAPADLAERRVDLELREAEIGNVLRLVAEVGQKNVVLDPCVQGKVDLKLHNVPVSVVLDVLASKLDLHYETQRDVMVVTCGRRGAPAATVPSDDERLGRRMSFEVREAEIGALLAVVAEASGLEPDVAKDVSAKVTMKLEGVRVSTVLAAIADATGLDVTVRGDRIVVRKRGGAEAAPTDAARPR